MKVGTKRIILHWQFGKCQDFKTNSPTSSQSKTHLSGNLPCLNLICSFISCTLHLEIWYWHQDLSQLARKLVGAELQQITYQEYLPVVLGKRALGNLAAKDTEYDQNVDPSILNEFATIAFRWYLKENLKTCSVSGSATQSLPIPSKELLIGRWRGTSLSKQTYLETFLKIIP